ncbi:MAG TPA: hypothetical protein VF593_12770 [Chthoniobacteraceae bacterium]|jgi:hypothetical protein
MRRLKLGCLIAFAAIGAMLFVAFGSYPSTGIPKDVARIAVRRLEKEPTAILTSESDLRRARDLAGTVWNRFSPNSQDGVIYELAVTRSGGVTNSLRITPTEWSEHGRTPRGFVDFIRKKEAEQNHRPRPPE